jgi:hypothetical protein
MQQARVVKVTYNEEYPKESQQLLEKFISKLLIKHLKLEPEEIGQLLSIEFKKGEYLVEYNNK